MAGTVVYPNGPSGPDDTQTLDTAGKPWYIAHPWLALGLGAGVAIVLFAVLSKGKASNTASGAATTPTNSANTGQAVDANGNPIEYVATSDLFYNYTNTTGSYNTTDTTNTNIVNNPPAPPPPNPGPIVFPGPPPRPIPGPGQPPPPTPTPPPPSNKGQWACTYSVVGGDTLSKIAREYGTTWPAIYAHNTATINAVAAIMHFVIPGGPWNNIRPGEVLTVPCR